MKALVNYQTTHRHIMEDSTLDFAWYYLTNRGPVMGRDVEFEKAQLEHDAKFCGLNNFSLLQKLIVG
jgi:hypothetical protein